MKVVQKEYPKTNNTMWSAFILGDLAGVAAALFFAMRFFTSSFGSMAQLKLLWNIHGMKIIPMNSIILIGVAAALLLFLIFLIVEKKKSKKQLNFVRAFDNSMISYEVIPEAPGIKYEYRSGNNIKTDYLPLKSVEARRGMAEPVLNIKKGVLTISPKN